MPRTRPFDAPFFPKPPRKRKYPLKSHPKPYRERYKYKLKKSNQAAKLAHSTSFVIAVCEGITEIPQAVLYINPKYLRDAENRKEILAAQKVAIYCLHRFSTTSYYRMQKLVPMHTREIQRTLEKVGELLLDEHPKPKDIKLKEMVEDAIFTLDLVLTPKPKTRKKQANIKK